MSIGAFADDASPPGIDGKADTRVYAAMDTIRSLLSLRRIQSWWGHDICIGSDIQIIQVTITVSDSARKSVSTY